MSTNQNDPVVPTVVRELLGESEKIRGWIEKLADHANSADPKVFERVRGDYVGRLDGLGDDLQKHRSDLLVSLEDRRAAADSLRDDRAGHAADLEEAGLRHDVGEYEKEEWDSRRKKIQGSLDKVDSLLAVEDSAVAELTAVVESIEEHTRPVAPIPLRIDKTVTKPNRPIRRALDEETPTYSPSATGAPAPARSWSEVLSSTPPQTRNGVTPDDDELAFLEAMSSDDLDNLDPIVAAMRDDE
ncbi:MAG: hypothetical protein R3195_12555 [Gemmatimonadota bacterium]|nr:hypothetical protein [Gemmatimonadota bacterium]